MSQNNSTRKLRIGIYRKPNGDPWVYVDLLKYGPQRPRVIPAFRDLHRIIRAIAKCEDESYPPPAKGRTRLAEFLVDAVYERDFHKLAVKYQIPERDGDQVINANGAKLRSVLTQSKEVTADDIRW